MFITITGADDSTPISKLIYLSEKYPFVEWGILKSNHIKPRFPSPEWIEELLSAKLKVSQHICYPLLDEILEGKPLDSRFNRTQLNITDQPVGFYQLFNILQDNFILQVNPNTMFLLINAIRQGKKVVPLHDASQGKGISPKYWADPIPDIINGYAGGINPDNIAFVLKTLSPRNCWIDMETGVRTNNIFDLDKIEFCLKVGKEKK